MEQRRCFGCMKLTDQSVCPHCGYPQNASNEPHQLPAGTVLQDQYQVGRVLGQGGFGITYLGWDLHLERLVAIKEFYPSATVNRDVSVSRYVRVNTTQMAGSFEASRERFLREARALAKLTDVPEIVGIYSSFQENNTAYIVMEFVKGTELAKMVQKRGGPMGAQETLKILKSVVYALDTVHKAGLVHRDISPDNIILHPTGGAKILDFGAVRAVEDPHADRDLNKSTEAIVKQGFAPVEQYRNRGGIGPWTDEYALCGTIYYCLTGRVPVDAVSRSMGEGHPDWQSIPGLTMRQRAALEKGMSVLAKDRFPSVAELAAELYAEEAAGAPPVPPVTQAMPNRPGPQYAPPAGPQFVPPQAPQGAPRYAPQAAPQYAPQYPPQYPPQGAPQYGPQGAPQAAPPYMPQPVPMPQAQRSSGVSPLVPILGAVAVVIVLVICFFTVHIWKDATCDAPRTCALCGKTEGRKLEHAWADATCETPETCRHCGKTRGTAGHKWKNATCETAMTCRVCGKKEGSPLGHNWKEATYDDPETCRTCGKTQGLPKGYISSVAGDFQRFTWGRSNTSAYIFSSPVYGCKGFNLFFEPTFNYNSWVDDWKLLYQDTNGVWHEYCSFSLNTETYEHVFTFDPKLDIKAVAVVPKISGSYSYSFSLGVWSVYYSP